MTDENDDQVSIASSLEIVDALLDASEDLPKEENNLAMDQTMSTSQYAQVIFNDIEDYYPLDLDLICRYTLTPGLEPGHGDRVALYKLPYLQPQEYVAYVWSKIPTDRDAEVSFASSILPKEEDFYQFQYLKGDNSVAGASVPFQLKNPGGSSQEVCGVREEGELMVVQTSHTILQEKADDIENKYTGLLELSEKLADELNFKSQSFVVLEDKHKSLLETVTKYEKLEDDFQKVIAEKLQLDQTLKQTNDTLEQTERVLNTTSTTLETVEKNLEIKTDEVRKLEDEIAKVQAKADSFEADKKILSEEKEKMAKMLDLEIKARELLLKEKQELVDKLDDTSNMLNAAAKSKELAIQEIRNQIEQQDQLRQELATSRQNFESAKAELVLLREELDKHNHSDNSDVAIVLSSLGAKLEAKEAEVIQKNNEIEILKEETKSIPDILTYETNIQELKNREQTLIRENSTYIEENKTLKQRVSQLEREKLDLVKRLEAGAAHYKKLAAEKQTWEKSKLAQGGATDDNCAAKIESLESKIVQLSKELRDARTSQDMQLSQISKAVSIVSMSASERDIDSLDSSISGLSNMDSVKIGNALQGTQSDLPSLFQPFPPSLEAPETSTPATSLPPPLVPDNADPTVPVPEMQPRSPAPYSSSGPSSGAGPVEDPKKSVSLECPLCNESFPDHSEEQLQQHVDVHLEQVVECPICGKTYDKKNQDVFEDHVQDHFRDQNPSLEIRGWDLGID